MSHFIVPIATAVVVAVLAPIVAVGVSPTRNILLGLAPEEAVLSLADEIDKSRVETEAKVTELQSMIEAQSQAISFYETRIAEQEAKLTEQEQALSTQKTNSTQAQQSLSTQVANQAKCQQLYVENTYCSNKNYRTKAAFDDYIDDREESQEKLNEMMKKLGKKAKDNDDEIEEAKKRYAKCQEIIKTCGY